MKVNHINHHLTDEHAVCVFIGRDATGKLRRPQIELDATDLAQLVKIAAGFRRQQRKIAAIHALRADFITSAGVKEDA